MVKINLSDDTYTKLKYIAQYVLPALGTLYFGLAEIWGFPYGEEVVGTIAVINIFLATVLGISAYQYDQEGKDISGTLYLDELPNDSVNSFIKFNKSEEEISDKTTIKLHVQDAAKSE